MVFYRFDLVWASQHAVAFIGLFIFPTHVCCLVLNDRLILFDLCTQPFFLCVCLQSVHPVYCISVCQFLVQMGFFLFSPGLTSFIRSIWALRVNSPQLWSLFFSLVDLPETIELQDDGSGVDEASTRADEQDFPRKSSEDATTGEFGD